MENEYYLALLLPEHITLPLRRAKTLAFQQTGDESFYKTPCCIILGKTELKDPIHNRLNITLTPKKEILTINDETYITFTDETELRALQKKYCAEEPIGIPLSLNGNKINFTLPSFTVTKAAIIIRTDSGFILKR